MCNVLQRDKYLCVSYDSYVESRASDGRSWWTLLDGSPTLVESGGLSVGQVSKVRKGKPHTCREKNIDVILMSTQALSSASHCVTSPHSKKELHNNAFKLHLLYVRSAI